ncbi:MAG: hypothetical protein FP833_03735 [Atribacteria sp.]|nr:hypothetical protein [Candidatus Atribacteria bacterium]MBU4047272.1 hypothetical protein [bacterium]
MQDASYKKQYIVSSIEYRVYSEERKRKEIQEKNSGQGNSIEYIVYSEEEIKKVASYEMQVNLVSWFVG